MTSPRFEFTTIVNSAHLHEPDPLLGNGTADVYSLRMPYPAPTHPFVQFCRSHGLPIFRDPLTREMVLQTRDQVAIWFERDGMKVHGLISKISNGEPDQFFEGREVTVGVVVTERVARGKPTARYPTLEIVCVPLPEPSDRLTVHRSSTRAVYVGPTVNSAPSISHDDLEAIHDAYHDAWDLAERLERQDFNLPTDVSAMLTALTDSIERLAHLVEED